MRRHTLIAFLVLLTLAAACRRESSEPVRVITSTEVAGTGLPQRLTSAFAASSGVKMQLQIVDAESLAARGFEREAAVVMTNDAALVERLKGRARLAAAFARADYVIVGPRSDPAHIEEAKTAPEAFRRIAEAQRAFCSPIDVPRYRARESAIWRAAKIDPQSDRRYRPCRGAPEQLLRDTASRFGYTIVDRGFASAATKERRLAVLFEGTPMLRNDYTALLMTPRRKVPRNAEWFIQWVMSYRGREIVDRHRVNGEKRFFNPD